jgi:uncharacterized membrane protein YfcA
VRIVLTGKDLAGTAVAALVVLAYVANTQDWWYLGNNRWAAVTITAIAAVGCPLGARIDEAKPSVPFAALGLLGVAALVLANHRDRLGCAMGAAGARDRGRGALGGHDLAACANATAAARGSLIS